VRRYVFRAKARPGLDGQKAYVPGEPTPGCEAEVDWGDVKPYIAGDLTFLELFCMRSKYSGKGIARAYPEERQQVLNFIKSASLILRGGWGLRWTLKSRQFFLKIRFIAQPGGGNFA
jgi:hypothetical protein